jgi:hypothetical protein
MQRILKQVVGINVAQKELVVSLGRMREDLTLEILERVLTPTIYILSRNLNLLFLQSISGYSKLSYI